MTPDAPDSDRRPPLPPSLAARAGSWARGLLRRRPGIEAAPGGARRITILLALLIPAGPAATWLGATLLANAARHQATMVAAGLAARRAADRQRQEARAVLDAAVARAGPVTLLDGLAAALPADAALLRAERRVDGMLELEIATSDPDALRVALRRVPGLAGLRDVRQQEGEGRTHVLLRQVAS